MKKLITIFQAMLMFCICFLNLAQADTGFSAYIIDHKTGRSLYEHNIHERRYPASITKVMTLYLIFEDLEKKRVSLNKPIVFSRNAASQPPSKIGVPEGKSISLELAINALIVKSANDVATAVAENLGGTEAAFINRMNKTAKRLGMYNTNFVNPHGLFHEQQYTTASDLIKLGIALHDRFPQYYKLFSTKEFSYNGVRFTSHNRVNRDFPGADGIKTGYIRKSGFNLLTSAKQNNRRLFAVILGGRTTKIRDDMMKDLLTQSFAQIKSRSRNITQINPVITRDMTVLFNPTQKVQSDKTRLFDKGGKAVAQANIAASPRGQNLPKVDLIAQSQQPTYDFGDSVAIQIGAYRNYDSAQNQARLVYRKVKKGRIQIINADNIYKAMLIGFNYDSAHSTCEMLKQNNTSCFIVRQ